MNQHTCHAHGCTTQVPPKMFMCKTHWYTLRKPMRDAIWREYRPGQERDKAPSASYMAVQRRAVGEVAFKPNDEAAATIAAPYLLEAETWRKRAIEEDGSDPLAGLVAPRPS